MDYNLKTPPAYNGVGTQRQVEFGEAIQMAFQKYAQFGGRSSRSEFWWWQLFNFIVGVGLGYIGALLGNWFSIITGIVTLALFIPSLMLCCRRLHDIGKGAGYIFIALIPLVGALILLYWYCCPSEPGDNRFGPMPNVE